MDGAEDGGGGDVVQVIMQDDGQIVMPEGQFIQLDTENSQMQYIQVDQQLLPVVSGFNSCQENPGNVHLFCTVGIVIIDFLQITIGETSSLILLI